jgi:muramoyltetrapeptide carboxypeptidase LdcA involved in peptidoglycan recycling
MPDADKINGLVIGRFQKQSGITKEIIIEIVSRQPTLQGKPVVANLDFGHTSPLITFPIGGDVTLNVEPQQADVVITRY